MAQKGFDKKMHGIGVAKKTIRNIGQPQNSF